MFDYREGQGILLRNVRPAVRPTQFPVQWVLVLKWPRLIARLIVNGTVLLLVPYDFIDCIYIYIYICNFIFYPFYTALKILKKKYFMSMKLYIFEIVYNFEDSTRHSSGFVFPKIKFSVRYKKTCL